MDGLMDCRKSMRERTRLKEYKAGTFDKRVAYGQRSRKLLLIARGVISGFRVRCKSPKHAENLARGLRIRASHIDKMPNLKYGITIKRRESMVFALRKTKG
jgi:hypothetical protein